ncbi:Putative ribonuclease H protein At1g65750 [Linum grandiflorum]
MIIAWDMGFRKLEVQLDSASAVHILGDNTNMDHQHMALARRFRQLCARDWEVRLKHVYREANVLADYIANIGHTLTIGNYEVGVRGNLMRHWMEHDILGVAQTRAIIM